MVDVSIPQAEAPSRARWDLYASEAILLGGFMISACLFGVILEHPDSPLRRAIDSSFVRRAIMGLAMGSTAVALVYSPLGLRSGALMNPATTLCFLRLGRITRRDALLYVAGQFIGGAVATMLMVIVLGRYLRHSSVNVVATLPGMHGLLLAWVGELVISFILMSVILTVNKRPALARFTGLFAGLMVAMFITFEAPISGMSMNPARTFASAFSAHLWTGLWIYFTAPIIGMLAAVELQRIVSHSPQRLCGKVSHSHRVPCFFKCNCLAPTANESRTS